MRRTALVAIGALAVVGVGVGVAITMARSASPPALVLAELGGASRAAAPSPRAFVLYTRSETVLVPIDPERPLVRRRVIAVQDEGAPARVTTVFPSEALPACGDPCAEGACTGAVTRPVVIDLASAEAIRSPCSCAATSTSSRCDAPREEVLPAPAELDGDDGAPEPCASQYAAPVSLVGGALELIGVAHDECGGQNVYDAASDRVLLVAEEPSLPELDIGHWTCAPDVFLGESPLWPMDPSRYRCSAIVDRWVARDGDAQRCEDACERTIDARVYLLRRGALWRIDEAIEVNGEGMRRANSAALSATTCPSAADPCGDPSLFPALEVLAPSADFWVATDGSAALIADGEMVRVLVTRALPRSEALAIPAADILGVRYHADATALAAVLARVAPPAEPIAPAGEPAC
ncbi:MAG: hypothetical protein M3Y87_37570, partial [Myxococcota bacterium]|nr:hypothetical protein [Myxococcota bacterium]